MSIVVPNEGEKSVLNLIMTYGGPTIGLFKNNVVVGDGTVIGDLVPAGFPGYAAVTLAYPLPAGTDLGGRGIITATQAVFTHSASVGSEDMYGWYIWFATINKLWKCGNFPAPITMALSTDVIKLTDTSLAQGTIT